MKHTREEIVNALKVIKEECTDHPRCGTCPFWIQDRGNGCQIQTEVETWEINSAQPELWRAFR